MLLCSGLGALLAVNASLWQTIMFVPCFATTHIIVRHLLHPSGPPEFYRSVILILPPSDDGSPERVRKYDKVTRKTLQKVLDNEGCDVVKDPISKDWVDFELLALQDDMVLITQRASTPMDKRVRLINLKR